MNIDTCPKCFQRLQKTKCKVKGFYYRHYKDKLCRDRPTYTIDEILDEGEK